MLNHNWLRDKNTINNIKTTHIHIESLNFGLKKPFLFDGKYNMYVDTETTGLNIITDTAFLLIFGYLISPKEFIVYTIEINDKTIPKIKKIVEKLFYPADEVFFMNTKFDIHMLENMGIVYEKNNLSDLSIIVRLLVPIEELKIGLKPISQRFFGEEIIQSAKDLDLVWKRVTKKGKDELNELLKIENNEEFINYVKIFEFIQNSTLGYLDLPERIKKIYLDWMKRHYKNNYYDKYQATYYEVYLDEPEILLKYAADDVILTAKLVFYLGNILYYKFKEDLLDFFYNNRYSLYLKKFKKDFWSEVQDLKETNFYLKLYEQEKKILPILYQQEREGLYVDLNYLEKSIKKIKVILDLRKKDLSELAGSYTTAGQHKKILEIFKTKFNITPTKVVSAKTYKKIVIEEKKESVDNTTLKDLSIKLKRENKKENEEVLKFIDVLTELRTLEKWYQTYAKKLYFRVLSFKDNRLHTSFNQSGTRTGRLSSDFQQFPKFSLTTILNGKEIILYDPRKIVSLDPKLNKEYIYAYLDFSNVELRVQAEYIQRWFPNKEYNLIRAFLPLGCVNIETNKLFNINDENDLNLWDKKNLWKDESTDMFWTPTDLHGLNAINAFGKDLLLPENADLYKHLRSAGKTINFACNYGAGLKTLLRNPNLMEFSEKDIKSLFNAYKSNYPGLKLYSDKIQNQMDKGGSMMFSSYYFRRYYKAKGSTPAYHINNYLVQGTAADYLKEKMIAVSEYIKENNLKIKLIANIHDEIQFLVPRTEVEYLKEIKRIMETNDKFIIPIVADLEISDTNWKEKKDYNF